MLFSAQSIEDVLIQTEQFSLQSCLQVSYSLYIEHHVGDGLLSVLLAVVEKNLLAAYYNVLHRQDRGGKKKGHTLFWRIKAVSTV